MALAIGCEKPRVFCASTSAVQWSGTGRRGLAALSDRRIEASPRTFINVVPFCNGEIQGEQIFFTTPPICAGTRVSIREVLAKAAANHQI
jgi:hypothetical protein